MKKQKKSIKIKPNYQKSIPNLVSSLMKFKGIKHSYKPLYLNIKTKKIILLLIDGMGTAIIKKHAKNTILDKKLKTSLTSVFPSTTASAMTTFEYGYPPQQTGLTGWFMHIKELGGEVTILPFVSRIGSPFFTVEKDEFIGMKSLDKNLGVKVLYPDHIPDIGDDYSSIPQMFKKIKKHNKKNDFVVAYTDVVDDEAHETGPYSRKVKEIIQDLAKRVEKLKLKDTTIIISADHGLQKAKKCIFLNDYPKIYDCLSNPLSGEPRLAYAYVYPSKEKQFLRECKKLKKYFDVYKSKKFLDENYFGLGKPHPKLKERIGDYILMPKDGIIVKDLLFNQPRKFSKGNHGGLSKEEMEIPLIIID